MSPGLLQTLVVLTVMFHSSESMFFFKSIKFGLGGIMPFSNIRAALISPAIPLELSRCPTFALMEPT